MSKIVAAFAMTVMFGLGNATMAIVDTFAIIKPMQEELATCEEQFIELYSYSKASTDFLNQCIDELEERASTLDEYERLLKVCYANNGNKRKL